VTEPAEQASVVLSPVDGPTEESSSELGSHYSMFLVFIQSRSNHVFSSVTTYKWKRYRLSRCFGGISQSLSVSDDDESDDPEASNSRRRKVPVPFVGLAQLSHPNVSASKAEVSKF
jgi:hypothetical protein